MLFSRALAMNQKQYNIHKKSIFSESRPMAVGQKVGGMRRMLVHCPALPCSPAGPGCQVGYVATKVRKLFSILPCLLFWYFGTWGVGAPYLGLPWSCKEHSPVCSISAVSNDKIMATSSLSLAPYLTKNDNIFYAIRGYHNVSFGDLLVS